jgi:hypothetical protein
MCTSRCVGVVCNAMPAPWRLFLCAVVSLCYTVTRATAYSLRSAVDVETAMDFSLRRDTCHWTVLPFMKLTTDLYVQTVTRASVLARCGEPPPSGGLPLRWSAYRMEVTNESMLFTEYRNALVNALGSVVTVPAIVDLAGIRVAAGMQWLVCDDAGTWIPALTALSASYAATATVPRAGYLVLFCTGHDGGDPDGFDCVDGRRGCQCEYPRGSGVGDLGDSRGTRSLDGIATALMCAAYVLARVVPPALPSMGQRSRVPVYAWPMFFAFLVYSAANSIHLRDEMDKDRRRGTLGWAIAGLVVSVLAAVATVRAALPKSEYDRLPDEPIDQGTKRARKGKWVRKCVSMGRAVFKALPLPLLAGSMTVIDTVAQRPSTDMIIAAASLSAYAIVAYAIHQTYITRAKKPRERTLLAVLGVSASLTYLIVPMVMPCSSLR